MTEVLQYAPLRDGYTWRPAYSLIEIALDGGPSRKRQDFLFPPHMVTVNWLLTSAVNYNRFNGFFRTTLHNGIDSFIVDLVTDTGNLAPHRCRLIGGLPTLTQQKGSAYYMSATLEVEANPTFTGLIRYIEPNLASFSTIHPRLVGPIQAGDTVMIMNTEGTHPSSTPLNLDGTYVVLSTISTTTLTLTDPELVNADWTVLAGLSIFPLAEYGDSTHGNIISTIMKIPVP